VRFLLNLNTLKVLSNEDLDAIHLTSVDLLESVGIRIESEEARMFLKEKGAIIDQIDEAKVKFPEWLIKENLKKVPKSFSLWGPDGSYKMTIDTNSTHFGTFGAAVNIYDPIKKKRIRKTTLQDTIDHIKVSNVLENIDCSHMDVWPSDIPFTELHCHTIKGWANNSHKPYGMSCFGKVASQDMINLVSIIIENPEEVIKKPRLIGVFNPTSPLLLEKIHLNGLSVFARNQQPLLISAAASAGSTAPVTLAGVLTQANMEVLSAIILTQLINPGSPVLYGSTNTIMDPITGNIAYGAIEMALLTIASAQLARFYQIPSKGSGALTDSKTFDMQNGIERFMGLSTAVNAGHNYITCAGTYESSLSEALELLVIDDELIGMLKRGKLGIEVNETTLAHAEIISAFNLKKNYLGTKHSVKNTRKEIFVPKLMNREKRGRWLRSGSNGIFELAREKVKKILHSYVSPNLPSSINEALDEYIKKVSKRSLEDYAKLEGLSNTRDPEDLGGFHINHQ
jgi:trimethylamine--corrinoid protein Co-methyltransferase